jgi:hypothetical protein
MTGPGAIVPNSSSRHPKHNHLTLNSSNHPALIKHAVHHSRERWSTGPPGPHENQTSRKRTKIIPPRFCPSSNPAHLPAPSVILPINPLNFFCLVRNEISR